MKIYLNAPKESWVVDRFVNEWIKHNKTISTRFITNADIIWIISPWTWRNISKKQLKDKKVFCTIHHLDPAKFDQKDFEELDQFVNSYHIITKKTENFLRIFTKKEIFYSPFWIDSNKFYEIKDKSKIRTKNKLQKNDYIIGSFQRDTESADNKSPKLEKGPDNFIEIASYLYKKQKNLYILLTGINRNYIINNLKKLDIPYLYLPMVDGKKINELYNCLNLYIVASRVEGGPQSILECALSKTPIISTDVGIANEILSSKSIFDMPNFENATPDTSYAYEKVQNYTIPNGFQTFISKFKEIYEN